MEHSTGTPKPFFTAVAGHTRLFRREGGTYYLRAKVPENIRPIIGKTEIRKSLRTKEQKQALTQVKVESLRVDREFDEAVAKLEGSKPSRQRLSQEEIRYISAQYVVNACRESELWTAQAREESSPAEIQNISDDLVNDAEALDSFSHTSRADETSDGSGFLDEYLRNEGQRWGVEPDSEDYRLLVKEFRRARVEILNRSIDRINGRRPVKREFDEYSSQTILPPPPRQQIAFGKFLDEFMEYQRATNAETAEGSYAVPVRVLREIIGEKTPLSTITKQHIERVLKTLREVPVNATQRYPDLTIENAIEAARRLKDERRISQRTFLNYYTLIVAIFNFAKEDPYSLPTNPAHSRTFKRMIKQEKKPVEKRALFTDEELKAIFHAPLYTGCVDDNHGYAKVGSNVPRRGRFWVPLLALFHGLRSNEACQLHSSDVKSEKEIPFLYVRSDLDEEEKSDKRVKNASSRRKIPIHPELLRMGFMDYVEERRRDTASPRLFPGLKISKTRGRYSHVFSKWFGRFLTNACGHKPKATFHSFRHHFGTNLANAHVPDALIDKLAGWQSEGMLKSVYYHGELPELLAAISKVAYPPLDLSHLYVQQPPAV